MNHIIFCINNNWATQCSVVITSIDYFNKEAITYHIISSDLEENNKNKLKKSSKNKIIFYDLNNITKDYFIIRPGDHVTIETYFRFFIPTLLDNTIKKVLYLDADILCTANLQNLFDTDISNKAAGMVLDCRYCEISKYNRLNYDLKYGYYNAGVMLMNLDYWRENDISKKLISFLEKNKAACHSHDQDAINALLHKDIIRLQPKYNVQTILQQYYFLKDIKNCPRDIYYDIKYEKKYWKELEENLSTPCLIHFTDNYKPWIKSSKIPFTEMWRVFLNKSNFSNYKLTNHIYPFSNHTKNQLKRFLAFLKHKKASFDNFPKEMYEVEINLLNKISAE